MAAVAEKSREPSRERHDRAGEVSSRQGPVRRRGGEVDEQPGHGLHQSSGVEPTPSKLHRSAESSGAPHTRESPGHAATRTAGGTWRSVDPAAKSPGDVLCGSGLALSSSPGADTSSCSDSHNRVRKEADGPHGDSGKQAQGDDDERKEARQIGVGRRCSKETGHRDATYVEPSDGAERARPEKGGLRRDASRDRRHRKEQQRQEQRSRERKRKGAFEDSALSTVDQRAKRESKRRREGETEGGRKGQGPSESDAPEILVDEESLETVLTGDDGVASLEMLKTWLATEETGGLSVAQSGALLALSVWRSGTPLGAYLHRVLEPGSDDGEKGGRQRGVLPIPLLPDVEAELKKLFESGEFRRLAVSWGAKRQNKEKAARQARKTGMLLWHGLVVTGMNFLWTGGGAAGKVCRGAPTKVQQRALDRLWETVRDFLDDTSEVGKEAGGRTHLLSKGDRRESAPVNAGSNTPRTPARWIWRKRASH